MSEILCVASINLPIKPVILNINFLLTLGGLKTFVLHNNIKCLLRSIWGPNFLVFILLLHTLNFKEYTSFNLGNNHRDFLNFEMVSNTQTSLVFVIVFFGTIFTFALLISKVISG